MRRRQCVVRGLLLVAVLPVCGAWGSGSGAGAAAAQVRVRARCVRVSAELRVAAGQSVRRRLAKGLDVALEARATGWAVRVLPHDGPAPPVDFAEIASPPYRSVSPLLLTTDFGFRAQDAVGWNPREFHFVGDRGRYARVAPAYAAVTRSIKASSAEEATLIQALHGVPTGRIEIVDATLVPGIADQSRAAAAVASHFNQTAHTVVAPAGGSGGEPMGRVTALAVRISLDLPAADAAGGNIGGVMVTPIACSAGAR